MKRIYLPRPEYPRPDRQRGFVHGVDWLNLNGAWEFCFDGERRGIEEQWFVPGQRRWAEQIIVPFCWESLAAWGEADASGNDHFYSRRVFRNPIGLDSSNYRNAPRYEVGWYKRFITIPRNEHWEGKRVILTIGAADFFTDCWCNGQHMGHHEGGYTPFEFDLTDALQQSPEGELTALIVMRVEDPMENSEQPVGKQWGWYCSASGIWQTVFLEPRASAYIERYEVTSDLEAKQARFKVYVQGNGDYLDLEITNPLGHQVLERFEIHDGAGGGTVSIDPLFLWFPDDPQLYQIRLVLHDGNKNDIVHGYFGMRTLSAGTAEEEGAPALLCLNGQSIYIRGALYQSYHADGVYTAGDVQALKDDIKYAKRFGFDLLRIHIKIDDPLVLYYADTLGILLMADFPNFGEGGDTPLGRRRYEEMMRAGIARDFNHPSIVAWCLFNETWGFGGQTDFVGLINPKPVVEGITPPAQARIGKLANQSASTWVESMWHLAKSLDSTRLIEDMSVVAWEHLQYYGHGRTDVNSWHFYTHSYEHARDHIREVVKSTYTGSTFNYVPGYEQGAQPLMNSEYGGVGALDGDRDVSWSFKFLTNELRIHEKLSAYIYTELHDVEWERNGFLNYDRTPKDFGYDPTIINQGDVLPIAAPPISELKPLENLEIDVFSSHFSRRKLDAVTLYWRLSGIDSLGWLNDDLLSGNKPIPFTHLHVELAGRIALKMPAQTMLCTLWVRAMTSNGFLAARNYIQFFVTAGLPAQEEIEGRHIFRAEPHTWSEAQWSENSCAREIAEREGCAYGHGWGFFQWCFNFGSLDLKSVVRIRVLCEASSRREGNPQTDAFVYPTTLRMLLNGRLVHESILPNQPHDARGALSYLRDGRGAYGYLSQAAIEANLLQEVLAHSSSGNFWFRCEVPEQHIPNPGGLTIYGSKCGRYPLPPTLIVETR